MILGLFEPELRDNSDLINYGYLLRENNTYRFLNKGRA